MESEQRTISVDGDVYAALVRRRTAIDQGAQLHRPATLSDAVRSLLREVEERREAAAA